MATVIHSHSNEAYSHVIKFDHTDTAKLPGGKGEDAYFELHDFLPKEWVLKDIAVLTPRRFQNTPGRTMLGLRVGVHVEEDSDHVDNMFTPDGISFYTWPIVKAEQIGGVPTTLIGASGNNGGTVRLTFDVSPGGAVNSFNRGESAVLLNIIDVGEIAKGIWPQ